MQEFLIRNSQNQFNGRFEKPLTKDDVSYSLTSRYWKMGKTDPYIFDSLHGFGHGWQGYHTYKAINKGLIRRLTPKECERLQGFPDDWTLVPINYEQEWDGKWHKAIKGKTMSDTQRYKQMGNAVSIPVIEAIGKAVLNAE